MVADLVSDDFKATFRVESDACSLHAACGGGPPVDVVLNAVAVLDPVCCRPPASRLDSYRLGSYLFQCIGEELAGRGGRLRPDAEGPRLGARPVGQAVADDEDLLACPRGG